MQQEKKEEEALNSLQRIMDVSMAVVQELQYVQKQSLIQSLDFWASLEHKIYYKYEGNTPEYIKQELKECADLVTFLDSKMLAINEEVRSIRKENGE